MRPVGAEQDALDADEVGERAQVLLVVRRRPTRGGGWCRAGPPRTPTASGSPASAAASPAAAPSRSRSRCSRRAASGDGRTRRRRPATPIVSWIARSDDQDLARGRRRCRTLEVALAAPRRGEQRCSRCRRGGTRPGSTPRPGAPRPGRGRGRRASGRPPFGPGTGAGRMCTMRAPRSISAVELRERRVGIGEREHRRGDDAVLVGEAPVLFEPPVERGEARHRRRDVVAQRLLDAAARASGTGAPPRGPARPSPRARRRGPGTPVRSGSTCISVRGSTPSGIWPRNSRSRQPGTMIGSNVGFGMKRLTRRRSASSTRLPSLHDLHAALRELRVEVPGERVERLVVVVVGVDRSESPWVPFWVSLAFRRRRRQRCRPPCRPHVVGQVDRGRLPEAPLHRQHRVVRGEEDPVGAPPSA